MHAERRASKFGLVVLCVVAMWAPSESARAWCQMTSSNRTGRPGDPCILANPPETFPLAWRRRCTSLSLSSMGSHDLSPNQVRGIFEASISAWENVLCDGAPTGLSAFVSSDINACTNANHFTNDRNVHAIIFVPSGWSTERMHDPRAYAVTLVWHDRRSGEIWDVDMEINEQRGPYTVCPPSGCSPGVVDLQNVVTHEMGHYFGLAHTPDDRLATMWGSAEPNETFKRDLQPDDIEGICAVYAPGTLPEACDPTPRGGLNLECTRRGNCDCSVPGMNRAPGINMFLFSALFLVGWLARRRV